MEVLWPICDRWWRDAIDGRYYLSQEEKIHRRRVSRLKLDSLIAFDTEKSFALDRRVSLTDREAFLPSSCVKGFTQQRTCGRHTFERVAM